MRHKEGGSCSFAGATIQARGQVLVPPSVHGGSMEGRVTTIPSIKFLSNSFVDCGLRNGSVWGNDVPIFFYGIGLGARVEP